MTKQIPLTQGKVALVDDEDYSKLIVYKWRAHRCGRTWYAETGSGKDVIQMHRLILDLPNNVEADHKNGDGLDNTRSNLRPTDRTGNARNRIGWSLSGYKGVYQTRGSDRWFARIQVDKKMIHLGGFLTTVEAARAYDDACVKYHGEFARLNFPPLPTNVGLLACLI